MESIKNYSEAELLEQINNCEKELSILLDGENPPHEGDLGNLQAELYIARREAKKRGIL